MRHPLFFLTICLLAACSPKRAVLVFPVVFADVETPAVKAASGDDAADDPAIWANPADASKSAIIGTVKKFGLEVYDLQGKRLHSYQVGNPNNVDLRAGFGLANGEKVDIAACTDRSTNQILIFKINPEDASLTLISGGRIQSKLQEVYGFCLHKSQKDGHFYAFLNGKDGSVEQYQLLPFGQNEIGGELKRTFKVSTQPEGMVADDALGTLYVGEEDKGVWKISADVADNSGPVLVPNTSQTNPTITYDIEGLTIFPTTDSTGFLLVSSQGNNSYAVFERQGENRYLGSFRIGDGPIDGTFDTDGIDVCAKNLGGIFSKGVFVAQDGANVNTAGRAEPQNFKLVSWEKIEAVLKNFGQ